MKVDIKKLSQRELEKLAKDIDKALERVRRKDIKVAKAAAEKAVKAYGFTLAEVMAAETSPRSTAKRRKSSTPKYVNPADKSQTWTGKGRQPEWFKQVIASGKQASDLEIQ